MNPMSLAGARILIVEDSFIVADSLKDLLTAYGGSVSGMVPEIEKALAVIAEGTTDFAILDIDLKGTNVAPLARELRRRGIGFLFLSGYSDENLVPEDLRGILRLDKPVEPERLVEAILQGLGGAG
jgi:two-component SAPR family response regulator